MCINLVFANDFQQKIIIKKYDDDFTLIDLKQEKLIQNGSNTLSSLKENYVNAYDINVSKEDSHKDFALIFAYGNNFKFAPFYESSFEFAYNVFDELVEKFKKSNKMILLNQHNNDSYQDFSFFCNLGSCEKLQLFDSNMFLSVETNEHKRLSRIADFILFVALEDFKLQRNETSVKLSYKIADIKNQKILLSRTFELSYETNLSKEPLRSKNFIIQSLNQNIQENLRLFIE